MGRVSRYKKAKKFQYGWGKEPDILGEEGSNAAPKNGDQPMPSSLRRMLAAQAKMKQIEGRFYPNLGLCATKTEEKTKKRKRSDSATEEPQEGGGGGDRQQQQQQQKKKKKNGHGGKGGEEHQQEQDQAEESNNNNNNSNNNKPKRIKFEEMRPDETYRQFVQRVRQQAKAVLRAQAMEEKKGISKARKEKLREKEEKRKRKKAAKDEGDGFVSKDVVKFGEVVQQPPSLTTKPKIKRPAAAVSASRMVQQQEGKKNPKNKKMTKQEKKEERERRKKMDEEEKERERQKEEKDAQERRTKQLLLARVMESYKFKKEQQKQKLKEVEPSVKREMVHYL